ncbi:MAG: TIR domain-containing protein [Terrisporobacter othiniensis]|uniref:TIR domain-containing protein n=1 Tax=Terrisporobacter othiniensis TaxID=1577792 RepID=UPI0029152633|nr:TIR domain-containing protein [Terrisporobacter othiniensis]MDU6983666.1 TIR domain-containing protein [Terrisporobacter othiniensis]
MGRKIFVSYKYADSNVKNITGSIFGSTVRDYVNKMEELLDDSNHIYKGESDGEDLSTLSDNTIWDKLKNRIYDSTLTIVMISPNMKELFKMDKDQWIPREISYCLKEPSRVNKNGEPVKSKTNAMLAIVVPDQNNSYNYYTYKNDCCDSSCRILKTNTLFDILKNNMFNLKDASKKYCDNGSTIWYGDSSYVSSVTWDDFIKDMDKYIDKAYEIQDNIDNYEICKEI